MAETTSVDEVTFDAKRKPDPGCEAKEERSSKIQKLEAVEEDSCDSVKNGENGVHKHSGEQIDGSSAEGKDGEVLGADVDAVEADDEEDYEDEEDDDSEEDSEKSSEKAAEDRKGKGIVKVDKGKGKLIEEDDDDEDSSDDDGSELGSDESDLSDDPLAEVDLDNILPSRTRRRAVHPGVYFATDLVNNDDDSSDSDA